MRSIWKGAVAFGLVNVPVKVYSATQDHDVSLHQVHDADGGRIRYQRRCEVCGEVVDYAHIDKAYDDGDRTVVLTDEDLASLPQERSREIEVVQFVPSDALDPIMFDRSYYLEPDSKSPKAYVLLRRTLEDTDRTAIVKFALRQKTRLGALRVREDVLMLQSLLWEDEVRAADFPALRDDVRISAREKEMSAALVDSFSGDFTPEEYTDEYQEQLHILIEAKLAKGDALDTDATFGESEETEPGQVLDLMEALKRSVERNRKSQPAVDRKTTESAAAKKPAAGKKTAGKEPAAKSSADKQAKRKGA
ncbi:Ku protein [Arthrobacter sp. H14-L1]|uniref:non-homologous end joining protein Ku n=1 Tax=Arthrobacter sp. H14-L1 TaxID=2996697 RepID=UPI00226F688D|nr:Ku protein [Arthrobacter sp. H14-L1]MCY0904516.1 Ku protein [Arthrobacter sp. H14-L1]